MVAYVNALDPSPTPVNVSQDIKSILADLSNMTSTLDSAGALMANKNSVIGSISNIANLSSDVSHLLEREG